MPPSPIPAPLPPWARALLQLAPLIPIFLQEALQYIGTLSDAAAEPAGEWRKAQLVWQDVGNSDNADRMATTIDIANITGGQIDSSWTAADYTTVNTQIDLLAHNWCSLAQARLRHVETRYYRMAYNPMGNAKPFAISGPPERVFPGTAVGSVAATSVMPNQVAMTHTEQTAYPRHWGRAYWPLPAQTTLDVMGHFTNAACDTLRNAVRDCYGPLQDAEFFPVVPMTMALKTPTRGLLTIDKLQVDNVPDVIRRRRLHTSTYKAHH